MKRIVRSPGYARAKLVNGLLFGALGLVVAYRTLAAIGIGWRSLPGLVFGSALLTLALVRLRDYAAVRRT